MTNKFKFNLHSNISSAETPWLFSKQPDTFNFQEINVSHKKVIDSITKGFPPYCDFQFSNLLSWSLDKCPTQFTVYKGNLLVRMKEYATDRVVTMFMGNNRADKVVLDIVNGGIVLERVPEEVIMQLTRSSLYGRFHIFPDSDNDDYILDTHKVTNLLGNTMKSKRLKVRKFERDYSSSETKLLDLRSPNLLKEFENFFKRIAEEKNVSFSELTDELAALNKLLLHRDLFDLFVIGVYLGGDLVGFTVNEIISRSGKGMALGCFGKGLRKYKGIYEYLEHKTSQYLVNENISYINIEEDIGFGGLRESKRKWRPVSMLRKYVVRKNVEM